MIPTFFGITLISFFILNLAPGSPIEQKIQAMRFGGGEGASNTRGNVGLNQEVIEDLKRHYGFDKPVYVRYGIWLKNLSKLDFGNSFTYEEPVIDVIVSKFPVSLQFGIATFFLTYLICIPLGVARAVKAGTAFDFGSSFVLTVLYAVPSLVLSIMLIVFFGGGSYYDWFPIGGLFSDNYFDMTLSEKIYDRFIHMVLPLTCYLAGGFTVLTQLMRNSMLDVMSMDYIRFARSKGLREKKVLFKHALRNALIPIATGMGGFLGVFLTGSFILENVFQLDGIGRLSYTSLLARDYNVIMAIIFLSSVTLMLGRLLSDLIYVLVDPRIDFK
ncbi:MAG: ABC transporter permease subunit [Bdellovibrionaceae bacterium]|nr:ABC transporter permease subunit [Pseudobdellovibrionaceae bacterium]